MSLKLMFITNEQQIAKMAEKSGVDWIFIDLEIHGKEKRQGHLDTVISRHQIEDVKEIKQVLTTSELLVRVNPIYEDSKAEINKVITSGADIVMLPFFTKKEEVEKFISYVNGRAKICLLCETSEAVENIDGILTIPGIDYIHIGLNDLHLSYKMHFMFEPLVNGTVEMLCKKIGDKGIAFGFGGIAQMGKGALPAENIIAEHYRLGSSMAILSRSFIDLKYHEKAFKLGIEDIREYEKKLVSEKSVFFVENHALLKEKVAEIVDSIKQKGRKV